MIYIKFIFKMQIFFIMIGDILFFGTVICYQNTKFEKEKIILEFNENARIGKEEFNTFIKSSGLKKGFVANIIGVPGYIIAQWLGEKAELTPKQRVRLNTFISDFYKNNAYMQS